MRVVRLCTNDIRSGVVKMETITDRTASVSMDDRDELIEALKESNRELARQMSELREENRRLRNERNLTYKNLYEDLIRRLLGGRG